MCYRKGGSKNDPITTLNNLHIKKHKNPPVYTETKFGRLYQFTVKVNWGEFSGKLTHGKKEAKTEVAQLALGSRVACDIF